MCSVSKNDKLYFPDDSNTYPPKIANPDESKNVSKKFEEVSKIGESCSVKDNAVFPVSESCKTAIPVPFDIENYGIHYSYIDYGNSKSSVFTDVKLDTNQIIYQFSDLNDVIVRKMISFRKNSLNFTDICKKPSVNSTFIKEFLENIDFVELTKNNVISKDDFKIIDDFIEYFNWDDLCKNVKISQRFMEKYIDKIKWDSIIFNITFTEDFIIKYSDKINFALLLNFENRVLSNDFVRAHIEELNINTEEKILRIFNNLPVNGNIFQMNGRIDDYSHVSDTYENVTSQDNTCMKNYEELREDLTKKVPTAVVSPWNNNEKVIRE